MQYIMIPSLKDYPYQIICHNIQDFLYSFLFYIFSQPEHCKVYCAGKWTMRGNKGSDFECWLMQEMIGDTIELRKQRDRACLNDAKRTE